MMRAWVERLSLSSTCVDLYKPILMRKPKLRRNGDWGYGAAGSASALQAEGRRFEPG